MAGYVIITVALLYVCYIQVGADAIVFKNCDASGTVTSMDVTPCPSEPCSFHKGTNASVKICFTTPASSTNATAEIDGIVAGVPVKFPMPNNNGCLDSGLQCPVTQGQSLCYTNHLAVLPSYPTIRVVVRWKLTGDNNTPLFCVLFPVVIEGSTSHQRSHHVKSSSQRLLFKARQHSHKPSLLDILIAH